MSNILNESIDPRLPVSINGSAADTQIWIGLNVLAGRLSNEAVVVDKNDNGGKEDIFYPGYVYDCLKQIRSRFKDVRKWMDIVVYADATLRAGEDFRKDIDSALKNNNLPAMRLDDKSSLFVTVSTNIDEDNKCAGGGYSVTTFDSKSEWLNLFGGGEFFDQVKPEIAEHMSILHALREIKKNIGTDINIVCSVHPSVVQYLSREENDCYEKDGYAVFKIEDPEIRSVVKKLRKIVKEFKSCKIVYEWRDDFSEDCSKLVMESRGKCLYNIRGDNVTILYSLESKVNGVKRFIKDAEDRNYDDRIKLPGLSDFSLSGEDNERLIVINDDVVATLQPVLKRHSSSTLSMLMSLLEGKINKKSMKLRCPPDLLLEALYHLEKDEGYHSFTVPKRDGSQRPIEAPCNSLKYVQNLIYRKLLQFAHTHKIAVGYKKGFSHVHALKDMLISMGDRPIASAKALDIESFFPSVTDEMIREPLRKVLRHLLQKRQRITENQIRDLTELIIEVCTVPGDTPEDPRHLVQGAPTSPMLANIALNPLFKRMQSIIHGTRKRLAERLGTDSSEVKIWAGQFSDDLSLFSNARIPDSLLGEIQFAIEEYGLRIKERKTRGADFVGNSNRSSFYSWGISVNPGRDGESNRFMLPGRYLKRLDTLIGIALGRDKERLLTYEIRKDFAADKLVAQIFGLLGYIQFVDVNGGVLADGQLLRKPRSQDRYIKFLQTFAHIFQNGGSRQSKAERDLEHLGPCMNPLGLRRHQILSGFGRLGRYVPKKQQEELEDDNVVRGVVFGSTV